MKPQETKRHIYLKAVDAGLSVRPSLLRLTPHIIPYISRSRRADHSLAKPHTPSTPCPSHHLASDFITNHLSHLATLSSLVRLIDLFLYASCVSFPVFLFSVLRVVQFAAPLCRVCPFENNVCCTLGIGGLPWGGMKSSDPTVRDCVLKLRIRASQPVSNIGLETATPASQFFHFPSF